MTERLPGQPAPPDWSVAADPQRRVGHAVEAHAEIGSTNDRARELLREPDGDGVAVVAELQTTGRGRRGRPWESPRGVNLMASVGLRPALDSRAASWLGMAAALAVRDACATFAPGSRVAIRWPNDIVTDDGLKVAGVLVETAIEDGRTTDVVIGMGINVNWRRAVMPPDIGARATSLADLNGVGVNRVALLSTLLDRLEGEIGALKAGVSPVDRFRQVSALDGRAVEVAVGDERIAGTAAGIADDGSLLLDAPAGRVALTAGEVVSVRDVAEVPA